MVGRTAALLLGVALVSGCSDGDPGSVELRFVWDQQPQTRVFIWTRVEERSVRTEPGEILAGAGPLAYTPGEPLRFDMPEVPGGDNRVAIVEVRDEDNSGMRVKYYGVSEKFPIEAGKHTIVPVELVLQTPETELSPALVWLEFDGVERQAVGGELAGNATVKTRSARATRIVLANDASFSAALRTVVVAEHGCPQETDGEGVTWDLCDVAGWDLLEDMPPDIGDAIYTVFVKFVDRYGYESEIHRAFVAVDTSPPEVLTADVSPRFAKRDDTLLVTINLAEALDETASSLRMLVAPAEGSEDPPEPPSPSLLEFAEPQRAGESNAYYWKTNVGDTDDPRTFWFEVTLTDRQDNPGEPTLLVDGAGLPLSLRFDAVAPELAQPVVIEPDEFGLEDPADPHAPRLGFDFVVVERNPPVGLDETYTDCPTVRVGGQAIPDAVVTRVPALDSADANHWGFHYAARVTSEDWGQVQRMAEVAIEWADAAGNVGTFNVGTVRFDFVRPTVVACSLTPEFATAVSTIRYVIEASEPLSAATLSAEGELLFGDLPTASAGDVTWTWVTPAEGMGEGIYGAAALLVDKAGNASSADTPPTADVCFEEVTVDATPPVVDLGQSTIATEPEISNGAGDVVLAVADGGKIAVTFVVFEAKPLDAAAQLVTLEAPIPVPLAGVDCLDNGDGSWTCTSELVVDTSLYDPSDPGTYMYAPDNLEGSWAIRLQVQDGAGNMDAEVLPELVKVDFSPPQAQCSLIPPYDPAAPVPFRGGQSVILQVLPFEEAVATPQLVDDVDPTFGPAFFVPMAGPSYQFGGTVDASHGEQAFELRVLIEDLVGNVTDAAGTACTGGSLVGAVDGTPPTISAIVVTHDAGAAPELNVDKTVTAVFEVSGASDAEVPEVMLDTTPMQATNSQPGAAGLEWTFLLQLAGTEGDGPKDVFVTAEDAAGNAAYAVAPDAVTLDFTPPAVLSETLAPNPAKVNDIIWYAITVDDALTGTPTLTESPGGVDFEFVSTAGNTHSFRHIVDGNETTTDFTVTIDLVDDAGNTAGPIAGGEPFSLDPDVPEVTVVGQNGVRFSKKDGHNLVEVSFNCSEVVDDPPAGLDATLDGNEMDCSTHTGTEPNYVCQYDVTDQDTQGFKSISIAARDGAGNIGFGSAQVAFDFDPPIMTTEVAPNDPIFRSNIVYTATFNEALLEAPTLTIGGAGTLGFTEIPASTYAWQYPVLGGETDGAYTVALSFQDLVGNDVVDEPGVGFSLDASVPTISNLVTLAQRYSAMPGHNLVELQFDVAESVDTGSLSVTIDVPGGNEFACGAHQTASPNYSCTFSVVAGHPDGLRTITVVAADAAGNSDKALAEVVFDLTPPEALSIGINPSPAGFGDTVFATVSSDEPLGGASGVKTLEGLPAPAFALVSDTTYVYQRPVGDGDAVGLYTIEVTLEDLVGNVAVDTSNTLYIDPMVPTVTMVSPNAAKYSAQAGFELVTLSLGVDEDVGAGLSVTIDGKPMNCPGPYVAGPAPNLSCSYTVTDPGDTHGIKDIVVEATDAGGNRGFGGAQVFFDLLGPDPALTYTNAEPSFAVVGDKIVYTITPSEPLAEAPIVATDNLQNLGYSLPLAHVAGSEWVFDHTVAEVATGEASGEYEVTFDMKDDVGNVTTGVVGASFRVDATVPWISGETVLSPRYSMVVGYDKIVVQFDTAEDVGAGVVSVRLESVDPAFVCDPYQATSPNYTCRYAIVATDSPSEGPQFITITARDETGNTDSALLEVNLDFTPPGVEFSGLNAGTMTFSTPAQYTVIPKEPLLLEPTLKVNLGAGSLPFVFVPASEYVYTYGPTGSEPDGVATVTATLTDSVGNVALDLPLNGFDVDTSRPNVENLALLADATTGQISSEDFTWHDHGLVTLTFTLSETPATVHLKGDFDATWAAANCDTYVDGVCTRTYAAADCVPDCSLALNLAHDDLVLTGSPPPECWEDAYAPGDGPKELLFWAQDPAGNVGDPEPLSVMVDRTCPTSTILQDVTVPTHTDVAGVKYVAASELALLVGTASTDADFVEYEAQVNSGGWMLFPASTSVFTFTALDGIVEGTNTIEIRGRDRELHPDTPTTTFVFVSDTQEPTAPAIGPDGTVFNGDDMTVFITKPASDLAVAPQDLTYQVLGGPYDAWTEVVLPDATLDGSYGSVRPFFDVPGLPQQQTSTIYLRAVDHAGNTSPSGLLQVTEENMRTVLSDEGLVTTFTVGFRGDHVGWNSGILGANTTFHTALGGATRATVSDVQASRREVQVSADSVVSLGSDGTNDYLWFYDLGPDGMVGSGDETRFASNPQTLWTFLFDFAQAAFDFDSANNELLFAEGDDAAFDTSYDLLVLDTTGPGLPPPTTLCQDCAWKATPAGRLWLAIDGGCLVYPQITTGDLRLRCKGSNGTWDASDPEVTLQDDDCPGPPSLGSARMLDVANDAGNLTVVWVGDNIGPTDVCLWTGAVAADTISGGDALISSGTLTHGAVLGDGDAYLLHEVGGMRSVWRYPVPGGPSTQLAIPPGEIGGIRADGGRVALVRAGTDRGLLQVYQEAKERPLTVDPADHEVPDVDGERIVWVDYRHHSCGEIYLHDRGRNAEIRLTTTSCTGDPKPFLLCPRISGDHVIWAQRLGSSQPSTCWGQLYGLDIGVDPPYLPGDVIHITSAMGVSEFDGGSDHRGIMHHRISGDRVVFTVRNWSNEEYIYLYAWNGTKPGLGDTLVAEQAFYPDVSGNRMVWMSWGNGLASSTYHVRTCNLDLSHQCGAISSEVPRFVGSCVDDGVNEDYCYHKHFPRIRGDHLVWWDNRAVVDADTGFDNKVEYHLYWHDMTQPFSGGTRVTSAPWMGQLTPGAPALPCDMVLDRNFNGRELADFSRAEIGNDFVVVTSVRRVIEQEVWASDDEREVLLVPLNGPRAFQEITLTRSIERQLAPSADAFGNVVWQDQRDAGPYQIYWQPWP